MTVPRVIREVKPNYTRGAMDAKIAGTVRIEVVVEKDGTVGEAIIIGSLDQKFGLDQEALKAIKQWTFAPGVRLGAPVAVIIAVELTFTLK